MGFMASRLIDGYVYRGRVMYTNRFVRIKKAAELTGYSVVELIELGFDKDLSIYAIGSWFWFRIESPGLRQSVITPILIDDEDQLRRLIQGEHAKLHIDADGRFICSENCTDDNYLTGVEITVANLYCLKADVEALERKTFSLKNKVMQTGNLKPWLILDQRDPAPHQPWYTPARYFARQFVKENPTLLTKKPELEKKVVTAMNNVGVKTTRKGKFSCNGTILKAWVNVNLG
jgi:hypothetical protein